MSEHLDDWRRIDFLDDPVEGYCSHCTRCTWDGDDVGRRCRMTQPNGSVCDGVFLAVRPASGRNALRSLPLHRTEAGWPRCSTCDGGGCPDCTDPA